MCGLDAGFWVAFGICGQALFGLRFILQWLASERQGRSVMPSLFWNLSLPAGIVLFAYALWRKDPVFAVNEGLCVLIFARNIMFERAVLTVPERRPPL